MLFLTVFLERFCIDFGRDWEGFGPPWATKKKEFNAPKGEVDRNLVLESFLGGFGRVLGRLWGGFGASWPLLSGLLALFLATLSFKRAQERPKRVQEASKRVQEVDFARF